MRRVAVSLSFLCGSGGWWASADFADCACLGPSVSPGAALASVYTERDSIRQDKRTQLGKTRQKGGSASIVLSCLAKCEPRRPREVKNCHLLLAWALCLWFFQFGRRKFLCTDNHPSAPQGATTHSDRPPSASRCRAIFRAANAPAGHLSLPSTSLKHVAMSQSQPHPPTQASPEATFMDQVYRAILKVANNVWLRMEPDDGPNTAYMKFHRAILPRHTARVRCLQMGQSGIPEGPGQRIPLPHRRRLRQW